jgi:hypothetical protein
MTVSRPPPTAIDQVISSQDQLLLQFAFSDVFESSGGTIIGSLLKRLSLSFSPAIKSRSLRHAILAMGAIFVPPYLSPLFAERVEVHSALAYKALRKKTSIKLDEGDLFAVCLLTLLSCIQRDTEKFRIHLGGLIAIMRELQTNTANGGSPNCLAIFWPLARDIILNECQAVQLRSEHFEFCNASQQIIGPQSFRDRTIYFSGLFGVTSDRIRYYTYCNCIWQYNTLLRWCFRDTIYRQVQGNLTVSSEVAAVVSEVKVDLQSPNITKIFHEVFLSDGRVRPVREQGYWGVGFMYSLLLHHFCELLVIHMEADSVLQSVSSPEARMVATSLVQYVRTEYFVSGTPGDHDRRNQLTQSLFPRILWLAGLTLTREECPEGIISSQMTKQMLT